MLGSRRIVGRALTGFCRDQAPISTLVARVARGRAAGQAVLQLDGTQPSRRVQVVARWQSEGRRSGRIWAALIELGPPAPLRQPGPSGAGRRRADRHAEAARAADDQLQGEILRRRQAEQVLARLAALIDDSDDAIMSTTLDGTIVSWNAGAERLYGYAAREIEGCWVGMLVPSDRQARMSTLLARIARGQREHHYETMRVRKDGTAIDVSLSVSPIRSVEGTIIGAAMIGRGITLRKRLEAQLAQAQKFELIGQLAAGIAHEINTPIQYIGTNAGFLLRSLGSLERLLGAYEHLTQAARVGPVPRELLAGVDALAQEIDLAYVREECRTAVAQTLEGVRHVAKIVRSVKELAHPGRAQKTPADLHALIERAVTVTRNEWKYVADVVRAYEPSLPTVPCLPDELGQALVNILVNAAQAIAEAAPNGRKGTIRIATRRLRGWAEVSIADTGPGIPPEIQSRIFEPFFTTKEIGKGTGQGLAIVRSILHKHRGAVSFSTTPGRGTTFVIRLPLEPPAQPAAVPHDAPDDPPGR
jgi:PAS domain S-box-containing protein